MCIKNKWDKKLKDKYEKLLNKLDLGTRNEVLDKLDKLRKYSFCKSHSYSYTQLVYKIAYQKHIILKNFENNYKTRL